MLRLLHNNKGQNTAEYALLIALVVAGIIAMQTYSQRSLQARVRDASHFMTTNEAGTIIGSTDQYEPYYLQSNYEVNRRSDERKFLANGTVAQVSITNRERAAGGSQVSTYDQDDAQVGR